MTLSIAELVNILTGNQLPVTFTAYDGSTTGNGTYGLHLRSEKGLRYLLTSPGDLGAARAYISGELELKGVSEADPYPVFNLLKKGLQISRPNAAELSQILKKIKPSYLIPPEIPEQESPPRWKRTTRGLQLVKRHSKQRDAQAIKHHYDVSNTFYQWLLGPSMAYTCACYPEPHARLETAQENKFRLVFDKLNLKSGERLLDVGCGWGSMVIYAARKGIQALGVTLSQEQAQFANHAIKEAGLEHLAEVRFNDYRDVPESNFDAISSIGLTEHIGHANYPQYFQTLHKKLKPGGLLLNHSITRPDNKSKAKAGAFIDRYIFPDGELTGSGTIISAMQDHGNFEVIHSENLREHYALTLRDWNANLVKNWENAVAEVGIGTARVWGLYLAGCRLGFDRNIIQLHQVLAQKPREDNLPDYPLRPWWKP